MRTNLRQTILACVLAAGCIMAIASLMLLPGGRVLAQTKEKAKGSYSDSGKLPWVVTLSRLQFGADDKEKIVADFASKAEAEAARKDLDSRLSEVDSYKYIYGCRKRKESDATAPSDSTNPTPQSREVPPGSLKATPGGKAPATPSVRFKYFVKVSKYNARTTSFEEDKSSSYRGNDLSDAKSAYAQFKGIQGYDVKWFGPGKPTEDTGAYNLPELPPTKGGPASTETKRQPNVPVPGSRPAADAPSLGGKWTANRSGVRFEYEFKDDNTFDLNVTSQYFTQFKHGTWELKGDAVSARFQESGTPGTGGFSRARELTVKILSRDKMEIDGDSATRK